MYHRKLERLQEEIKRLIRERFIQSFRWKKIDFGEFLFDIYLFPRDY